MKPPPDPDDDAPGPVLSRGFWLAMAFAALSLAAAAIVATFGPRLFPVHPSPEARAGALGAGGKGRYETKAPFRPGPP